MSDSNSTRRRAISRAPAPISPIEGSSWRRPWPEEEVGDHLPRAPDGLISVALAIPYLMRERAAWGVTDARADRVGTATDRLADALLNELCCAVGIDRGSGDMVWIPLGTWRRTVSLPGGRVVSAPQAAMMRPANSVPVSFPEGSRGRLSLTISFYPYVMLDQLAAIFGAVNPPPAPREHTLANIADVPQQACAGVKDPASAREASQTTESPGQAERPPFNHETARALLVAKKIHGEWIEPPSELKTEEFLLHNFSAVPRSQHRALRHKVWPGKIKRGRRKRP